jgi:two-component system sensor histidine kinase UhpB
MFHSGGLGLREEKGLAFFAFYRPSCRNPRESSVRVDAIHCQNKRIFLKIFLRKLSGIPDGGNALDMIQCCLARAISPTPLTGLTMNPPHNDESAQTGWRSKLSQVLRDPFAARLAASAGTLIILTWGLLGFDLWSKHIQGETAAREQAAAIARAMDERVVRTLRLADQLLKVVGEEIKEKQSWANVDALTPILHRLDPQLDEILTLSFVDAQGVGIGQPNPSVAVDFSYTESDYFQAHSTQPNLGLFVEKPIVGPASGQRIFTVSRRISGADGAFLGVLVASIRTDALAADFASATIGKKGAAHLIHIPSRQIIVHQPDYQGTFGKSLPYRDIQEELVRAARGVFRGDASLDGEERIFAYRRIGDFPLAVSVGLATSEIRTDLLREFASTLLMALILSMIIGGGAVFILATHRREVGLKESMRRWQQIFEHAGWGIAVGSADGKTLEQMNPAYAHMHGYSVDELTGQAIEVVYPPSARKQLCENIALNHQQGHRRFESLHIHRDGHVFPVLIDATTVRGELGEILYRVLNVQDISQIRRAQEEMRIAREFFQYTFDAAPVGMAIADIEGRYTRVNRSMCEFTGYSESELLALNYADITHPDDIERNMAARQALLDAQCQSFQMEKRYIRKDGREIWALMVASLVTDSDGKPLYSIGQMLDITERKKSALALAVSRQKLRALAAYQEEMLELERKHIAREVHDELGQLLTALKMDISLVRLRFGDNLPLQEMIEGMRSLVEQTINVVRQVASNLRPAVLDHGLAPAIEWLADDFAQRWSIPCRVDTDDSEIELDEQQSTAVFRVIQESLTNVARHAQAQEVVISLRASKQQLWVIVKDDGCGFDTVAVGKARGFGLFGMRERLLALGGTLRIVSAPGQGTSVGIELSLANRTSL